MTDFIRIVMHFIEVQGIALVCRIDPAGQQYCINGKQLCSSIVTFNEDRILFLGQSNIRIDKCFQQTYVVRLYQNCAELK